jgi:hypothetical protein
MSPQAKRRHMLGHADNVVMSASRLDSMKDVERYDQRQTGQEVIEQKKAGSPQGESFVFRVSKTPFPPGNLHSKGNDYVLHSWALMKNSLGPLPCGLRDEITLPIALVAYYCDLQEGMPASVG